MIILHLTKVKEQAMKSMNLFIDIMITKILQNKNNAITRLQP